MITFYNLDRTSAVYMSYDGTSKVNPYLQYQEKMDDMSFGRNLSKSDIDGASPKKWKHRPRKFFVDRNEIKSVFNQKPGKYHGFLNDRLNGGTFQSEKPEAVFKWSLTNKKDLEAMNKSKPEYKFSPSK